jgi:hypothetical protein
MEFLKHFKLPEPPDVDFESAFEDVMREILKIIDARLAGHEVEINGYSISITSTPEDKKVLREGDKND